MKLMRLVSYRQNFPTHCRVFIVILIFFLFRPGSYAGSSKKIVLKSDAWQIFIQPDILEVVAQPQGQGKFLLSAPQTDLAPAVRIEQMHNRARWLLPQKGVAISMELNQNDLSILLQAHKTGTFTFPVIEQAKDLKALILPRWEGCYIPLNDSRWVNYLIDSGKWDTLEGLCMPFWGLDCGEYMLTYIVINRYNNEMRFSKSAEQLSFRFTHDFTPDHKVKEYGFLIHLGKTSSPIEPARQFRRWLIGRDKFVTMKEKMKNIPRVKRLLGAAHIYLWGNAYLSCHDIPRRKWVPFCKKLLEEGKAHKPSPGKRIKNLMKPDHWSEVEKISTMRLPYDYVKRRVTDELSRLLQRSDFYDKACWERIKLPEEAIHLLERKRSELSISELCRMNGLLLKAAYPEYLLDVDNWGDGVSVKMLKQFRDGGFDRLRLCVDDWRGVEKRPEVVILAEKLGYLFGAYDSYHSIHDPALRGTDATWETAQFDPELYEKGPIVDRNGKRIHGFKGKGYKLSPSAAFPYVKKRVSNIMSHVKFNYWFMDCDAYGEVYDDYSPLHPATQQDDVNARMARVAWIRDTYKVVIGSEGGSSYAAPGIHIAEGMFQPCFGWGDPDMKNKNSKYYVGSYYPPEGPKVFLQQVPLKEKYRYLFYDPRFRLPLYEVVFHDSVVTTHHWSRSSLKFGNVLNTVALTELLYMVPPLYHINLDTFKKHKEIIKRFYDFFSPLHMKLGFSQMTDFSWLDNERLVQRTVFANKVEIVANFSNKQFNYGGVILPERSVLVKWHDSRRTQIFTPDLQKVDSIRHHPGKSTKTKPRNAI